jgi:hypothetical protein
MGEQFIDLFAAGAYALVGRLYAALSDPSLSWLFFVLAAAGIVFAIFESVIEQKADLWIRHVAVVAVASVLALVPQRVELANLTYAAPGAIENLFGTTSGAAPHLTYWIERIGAHAVSDIRALTQRQPFLAVPGVAAQVEDIVSNPALINEPQLRANEEIWRRRIVPQLLLDHPDLAADLRDRHLLDALVHPSPAAPQFVGADAAQRARAVQAALASRNIDLGALLQAQASMLRQITDEAGASAWEIPEQGNDPAQVRFSQWGPVSAPARLLRATSAYGDALERADALTAELAAQLPQGNNLISVTSADQLYDLLARSVLYDGGIGIARDAASRATIGSLCQRSGDAVCRAAMSSLGSAGASLQVPPQDRYNTPGWTTLLEQPLTTLLLTITALLLKALSTLVVSVLPFTLGIAKTMAILISTIGVWLLLWPGRTRIALTWMVGPISFVTLWSVLFNLWAEIEPALALVSWTVGGSDHGSWSAQAAMSIAISLGYMGLPSLALGVVYGETGRALYHASARVETALMMAWHTRASIAMFARRWLVNSPLARRWNQRAYRAVGLGPLRPIRGPSGTPRPRPTKAGTTSSSAGRAGSGARTASAASPVSTATSAAPTQGELFPVTVTRRTPRKRPQPSGKPSASTSTVPKPPSRRSPKP